MPHGFAVRGNEGPQDVHEAPEGRGLKGFKKSEKIGISRP
jgi:hypothetical protein